MTEAAGWQRTSPFAALFYLGKVYQAIARNAVQSLAPLAAFIVAFRGDPMNSLLVGGAAFVLVTVVLAFLNYWFFRFLIADDSILIRQGVLKKKQLDIKFERVQAVNTQQNVLYRMLKLVTVSFDTAGSAGQEGYLPAVPLPVAQGLRERIRRTPAKEVDESRAEDTNSPERLVRLGAGDMLRIGLSSGRVFLALVLIGPVSEYASEQFGERIEETAVIEALGAVEIGFLAGLAFAAALVLAIILVLLGVSIVAAFLRYHRYELYADGDVLRSTSGLLTRHEQSVDRRKVQSLSSVQNVMLRAFRRFRLRARQASSSKAGRRTDFIVPVCDAAAVGKVSAEVFLDEFAGLTLDPRSTSFSRISPSFIRSRILLAGVLPTLAGLALLVPAAGAASAVVLLWLPVAAAGAWQAWRRYGVLASRDGLAVRSGFAGFRVVAWLHRKVQRVSVTQSPFQRRRSLATVRVHLAAGPAVKIPFIDYAAAKTLRDYILWRVESSRESWH